MTEYNDTHHPNNDSQTLPETSANEPAANTISKAPTATLWLIEDDAALRLVLVDTFEAAGFCVLSFTQAQAAWTKLNDILQQSTPEASLPDAIVTDIRMPIMDGLSFSDWVHNHFPQLPIIIMTAHSDLTSAINSYQAGAFEYLPKPFDLDEAVATIYKAIHYQSKTPTGNKHTKTDTKAQAKQQPHPDPASNKSPITQSSKINNTKATNQTNNPNGIIGQSQAMQTVFRAIGRLAHSPVTVLITGESGTGKELVASALHQHSPRQQEPFIALNMAAIPHDLIESELFGHEKGAYTGATTRRQGRFEQADGGTLFLDEIGDMPFSTQTRLLRVLANGEFYRVGGQQPIKVDVRIIAATHQDLEHLVQQGKFREDLFYRLNVIRLPLPPLRARREDIPALAEHFMQRAAQQMNTATKQLHPQAVHLMQDFDWRGNVRQLENVCLWLTVMATGDTVLIEDLPPELLTNRHTALAQPSTHLPTDQHDDANNNAIPPTPHLPYSSATVTWQKALADWATESLQAGNSDILQTAAPEFEQVLINAALLHSGGKKKAAAKLLGWGRNTLTRKLQQLDTHSIDKASDS
ncbi:nitrogen regulation protein NR(I) [Psychrobacter sp. F1192]|uniref:DNA-binding transcriptional regulator NtrC n=1 Tax=Psychrobacter coccoides TaxID=2818440 RepID=A0ABS3NKH7_9GAMM|nr:sigma 54-interacting transcriptional regulator [Psychrobacter coccoides]MBO1529909.1 nitrogen regulation protein NR(I) [Psychrobacter coccoides]